MDRTPHPTPDGSAEPARAVRQGNFLLPCDPATALPLFTPEGERHWVDGWHPQYLSGVDDEVGAVWRTSHGDDVTWITTDRDDDRVRYARVSGNGTAGLIEVLCTPADSGTRVQVTYDLTACTAAGLDALQRFTTHFDDMLEHWRHATTSLLARTPAAGQTDDPGALIHNCDDADSRGGRGRGDGSFVVRVTNRPAGRSRTRLKGQISHMEAKNLAELYELPLVDWHRVEAHLAGAPSGWPARAVTTTGAGWPPRTRTAART